MAERIVTACVWLAMGLPTAVIVGLIGCACEWTLPAIILACAGCELVALVIGAFCVACSRAGQRENFA